MEELPGSIVRPRHRRQSADAGRSAVQQSQEEVHQLAAPGAGRRRLPLPTQPPVDCPVPVRRVQTRSMAVARRQPALRGRRAVHGVRRRTWSSAPYVASGAVRGVRRRTWRPAPYMASGAVPGVRRRKWCLEFGAIHGVRRHI